MTQADPRVGIKTALATVDTHVYYGTAAQHPANSTWDYIVFKRSELSRGTNGNGFTDVYTVAIIREEYIPDGIPEQVIDAICAMPGYRLAAGSARYDYMVKPNTDMTVEMLSLDFTRSRK